MAIQDISSPTVFLGGYIKRCSATLGLNNNPTSVEVELVSGSPTNSYDIAHNATGFDYTGALPGKISGFSIGAFNFLGLIQSWSENYSSAGRTFNVKLSDPRIIFDNIPVVIGPNVLATGFNSVPNILNCFGYYSNPSGAGLTSNGTLFDRIKNYLESSGRVNCYGKPLSISLGSGFQKATGTNSYDGVPYWYTIQGTDISLGNLLQQVATEQHFDYYVSIDVSGYNPSNSVASPLTVKTIKRSSTTSSSEILNYVNNASTSGVLISYRRGQELKSEPNAVVVAGSPQTVWFSCNTSNIYPSWGRALDGSLIFNPSVPDSGIITLDHLTGTGVAQLFNSSLFRVDYLQYTISRNFGSDIYPGRVSVGSATYTSTGYYASEKLLRAALFNQDSWESILFKDYKTTAETLGIYYQKFRERSSLPSGLTSPDAVKKSLSIVNVSGLRKQSLVQQAVTTAVYEATRAVAENFYGKSYIAQMDTSYTPFISNWLGINAFSFDNGYPEVEYDVAGSAWSEVSTVGIPSGINNHVALHSSRHPSFKDESNKIKPFLSIPSFTSSSNSNFPYPIDMSNLSNDSFFIEQGDKLCIPISTELYERYPKYVLFNISPTVQGMTPGFFAASGTVSLGSFFDFLSEMGYSQTEIVTQNFINSAANGVYGLAPPRLMRPTSSPDNYGLFIPIQRKVATFGPWIATGTRPGPVTFNSQSDLTPERFGSYTNLDTAGNITSIKSQSVSDILDSAEITLAGLPVFNLGDLIGSNSNISSIAIQYGADGLTTSYGIRTYNLPEIKNSRVLNNRINKIFLDGRKEGKPKVDINQAVRDLMSKNNNTAQIKDYGFVFSELTPVDTSNEADLP